MCVHCLYLHHCRYWELMLSCEQAEPTELRFVIADNPPALFCDKADPHYRESVLIYVRNEQLIMAQQCIYSVKQNGPFGVFQLCLSLQ